MYLSGKQNALSAESGKDDIQIFHFDVTSGCHVFIYAERIVGNHIFPQPRKRFNRIQAPVCRAGGKHLDNRVVLRPSI